MQSKALLQSTITSAGRSLAQASEEKSVLLVFLRHFGCVFCKEAMKDIGNRKEEWLEKDINVILVHMSTHDKAEPYFSQYGVGGIENISDPSCTLYADFGLGKGRLSQLFGLKNFIRGFETTLQGIPIGLRQIGDGFQMPGVFMIRNSRIMESYIHASAADRPDYDKIISCCA